MDDPVTTQIEHYFVVNTYEGEPTLGPELVEKTSPDNTYTLAWVGIQELKNKMPVGRGLFSELENVLKE